MATEAAFTKGPWDAREINYSQGRDVSFEIGTAFGDVIAQTIMREKGVGWRDALIASDRANARLMAASPDMFEVVRQFVAHYPVGINPNLDEAYRAGRAAISRATEGAV